MAQLVALVKVYPLSMYTDVHSSAARLTLGKRAVPIIEFCRKLSRTPLPAVSTVLPFVCLILKVLLHQISSFPMIMTDQPLKVQS